MEALAVGAAGAILSRISLSKIKNLFSGDKYVDFYNVYPLLEDNKFEMEYADQKCWQLKQVDQHKIEDNSESLPTAYPVGMKHAWN